MAQQGKKVLPIGCEPEGDTTSLLFGGKAVYYHRDGLCQESSGRRGLGR